MILFYKKINELAIYFKKLQMTKHSASASQLHYIRVPHLREHSGSTNEQHLCYVFTIWNWFNSGTRYHFWRLFSSQDTTNFRIHGHHSVVISAQRVANKLAHCMLPHHAHAVFLIFLLATKDRNV